ncbi:MAG: hypothetical protein AABZ12_06940 [Planctomycetota bacterium]
MARGKRGPALFELLEGADLPEVITPRTPGQPEHRRGFWARLAESRLGAMPPQATCQTQEDPAFGSEPTPAGPWVELDADTLRVRLTTTRAAIVVFALVMCFTAAFGLGRRWAAEDSFKRGFAAGRDAKQDEAAGEIAEAKQQPAATYLVSGLVNAGERSAGSTVQRPAANEPSRRVDDRPAAPADLGKWVEGHTYVVAQEFAADRAADAGKAQEFLKTNGVECAVIRRPDGGARLITAQGFNRKDSGQRDAADKLLEKVRSMGAKFYASGGGYRLEGYFRTRKSDGW